MPNVRAKLYIYIYGILYRNKSKGHRYEDCCTIAHWGLGFVVLQCLHGPTILLYCIMLRYITFTFYTCTHINCMYVYCIWPYNVHAHWLTFTNRSSKTGLRKIVRNSNGGFNGINEFVEIPKWCDLWRSMIIVKELTYEYFYSN